MPFVSSIYSRLVNLVMVSVSVAGFEAISLAAAGIRVCVKIGDQDPVAVTHLKETAQFHALQGSSETELDDAAAIRASLLSMFPRDVVYEDEEDEGDYSESEAETSEPDLSMTSSTSSDSLESVLSEPSPPMSPVIRSISLMLVCDPQSAVIEYPKLEGKLDLSMGFSEDDPAAWYDEDTTVSFDSSSSSSSLGDPLNILKDLESYPLTKKNGTKHVALLGIQGLDDDMWHSIDLSDPTPLDEVDIWAGIWKIGGKGSSWGNVFGRR